MSEQKAMSGQRTLTGAERAALVLRELGEGVSVDIIRQMDETAIGKISVAMSSLPPVGSQVREEVMTAFATEIQRSDVWGDGLKFLGKVLASALGEAQARVILENIARPDRGSPFQKLDPQTLAMQMSNERPQTIALLLAHIPHETGAAMLSFLPEQLAAESLYRFTLLDVVSPSAVRELREMLGEIMATSSGAGGRHLANLGGARQAADILNLLQTGLSDKVLGAIEARDGAVAEKIRENLFTFIDLSKLSDLAMQVLLRHVPSERLVVALRPVDDTVRGKFFANMSERMMQLLKEELNNGPPVRRSDAFAAQNEIVATALRLAAEGRIVISSTEELI